MNGSGKRSWMGQSVVAAASLAIALTALGCGSGGGEKAAMESNEGTVAAATTASHVVPASTGAGVAEATPAAEGAGSATQETQLPPDVVASLPDGPALPGSVIEVTAQGSPDVTEVVLGDPAGRKHPFTYDAAANTWRVSYRVPLRNSTDQVGLSVTATNGANRFKRVWVFVKLPSEGGNEAAAGDSTGC